MMENLKSMNPLALERSLKRRLDILERDRMNAAELEMELKKLGNQKKESWYRLSEASEHYEQLHDEIQRQERHYQALKRSAEQQCAENDLRIARCSLEAAGKHAEYLQCLDEIALAQRQKDQEQEQELAKKAQTIKNEYHVLMQRARVLEDGSARHRQQIQDQIAPPIDWHKLEQARADEEYASTRYQDVQQEFNNKFDMLNQLLKTMKRLEAECQKIRQELDIRAGKNPKLDSNPDADSDSNATEGCQPCLEPSSCTAENSQPQPEPDSADTKDDHQMSLLD